MVDEPHESGRTLRKLLAVPVAIRLYNLVCTSRWENIGEYRLFLAFLWPAKRRYLQINAVVCVLVVLTQRVINLMVPIQMGRTTTTLTHEASSGLSFSWSGIAIYVVYQWLQGAQSLLSSLRSRCWTQKAKGCPRWVTPIGSMGCWTRLCSNLVRK